MVRQRIWERLAPVARPDTRFHFDFSEFIPDFEGSETLAACLLDHRTLSSARMVFVTPDNSLVAVRQKLLEAGRPFVVSSYNMLRGFLLLDPAKVPTGHAHYAAWLDGIEHFGRPVSLEDISGLGPFGAMVTGASAVSTDGIRFGKGHGYFDIEWGIFSDLGLVQETTPVIAAVHDVQVVADRLPASDTEIMVDLIATPTRMIDVERARKRPRGVNWDLLSPETIASRPPLRELARMRGIQ
ncbi:5-formyltetrahydrofolate cyclo-ligase [Pelagibacterium montanilacus]|uniref:5-formyltetrahydrofolate cyclo-ligase n=1 Tax=Pelagibacterium montanilacus TaxID=2185280 RepID=UPI001FE3E9D2|nr:5-formyltetrahydrofolate cyclo-ligase [Pelagibacterium montanilacus]